MIPTVIHQVFYSNHNVPTMPLLWKKYIRSIKILHPKWKYILWDNNTTPDFIHKHYPQWEWVLNGAQLAVLKSDIIRYLVVQHFGGWYLDLDCEALQKLDNFNKYNIVLPLQAGIEFGDTGNRIGNCAFGSIQQHVFLKKVLDNILKNKSKITGLQNSQREEIISLTGPKLLQQTFKSLNKQEQNECYLAPRENFHMPFVHPLTYKNYKSIKSNKKIYVLHHCDSTWRLNKKGIKIHMRAKVISQNPFLAYLSKIWNKYKARMK